MGKLVKISGIAMIIFMIFIAIVFLYSAFGLKLKDYRGKRDVSVILVSILGFIISILAIINTLQFIHNFQ